MTSSVAARNAGCILRERCPRDYRPIIAKRSRERTDAENRPCRERKNDIRAIREAWRNIARGGARFKVVHDSLRTSALSQHSTSSSRRLHSSASLANDDDGLSSSGLPWRSPDDSRRYGSRDVDLNLERGRAIDARAHAIDRADSLKSRDVCQIIRR